MSKSEFARAIGITRQNLHHHLKSGQAPPLGDVEAWTAFLAEQGRDATLPKKLREAIAKERLRLIKENVRKAKMENDAAHGELISFGAVKRFMHSVVGEFFFGELERLAHEFPATLKGQDEASIHVECRKQITQIKDKLSERIQAWMEKKEEA